MADFPKQSIVGGDLTVLTLRNNSDWLLVNFEEAFEGNETLKVSFKKKKLTCFKQSKDKKRMAILVTRGHAAFVKVVSSLH